jgi:hypothetical protein
VHIALDAARTVAQGLKLTTPSSPSIDQGSPCRSAGLLDFGAADTRPIALEIELLDSIDESFLQTAFSNDSACVVLASPYFGNQIKICLLKFFTLLGI